MPAFCSFPHCTLLVLPDVYQHEVLVLSSTICIAYLLRGHPIDPFAMQDLTYSVRSHHNKKVDVSLLTSVSGFFNPGQMSALVGHYFLR